MQDPVSELARRARELPPEDRERVVDELAASFTEGSVSEVDPAWDAEIARRLAEIDEGKVELLDGRTVLAEARRRFG